MACQPWQGDEEKGSRVLARYRCDRYNAIEAEFAIELKVEAGRINSAHDETAKASLTRSDGVKRSRARRLNSHIRYCGLCR